MRADVSDAMWTSAALHCGAPVQLSSWLCDMFDAYATE